MNKFLVIVILLFNSSFILYGMNKETNVPAQLIEIKKSHDAIFLNQQNLESSIITAYMFDEAVASNNTVTIDNIMQTCDQKYLSHLLNHLIEKPDSFTEKDFKQKALQLEKISLQLSKKHSLDSLSPLTIAIFKGHTQLVTYLIERGSWVDFAGINHFGISPLETATFYRPNLIPLLIKQGAQVDGIYNHDAPIFITCIETDKLKAAKKLLKYGASLDVTTRQDGLSPMAVANLNGKAALIQLFISTLNIKNDLSA